MSVRAQQICAASGLALLALFFLGFGISGFITPPSPEDSAQQIAQMFAEDRTAIRIGLLISMFATALLVPWAVALFLQLRRAEGARSPWAYVMMLSATLLSLEFIYLIMFWQVAAFREELPAETVRMLHDLAWVPFVGITSTGIVMAFASAAAVLSDRRPDPVFPRWLGYYNLWVTFMFTPGSLCVFFKTGPFAYNGILAWYVPVSVFATWMLLNTYYVLRAIQQELDDARHRPSASVGDDQQIADLARELAELRREVRAEPRVVDRDP